MTEKSKRLLIVAAVVAVLGIGLWLWWNAPVRAATRALLKIADTLQVDADDSSIARQGKGARLGRAISDPVDIKFQEAGREGLWSAEALQMRYIAGAMNAKTATIALEDVAAEESENGSVVINCLIRAKYVGQGSSTRDIERLCRWIMKNEEGRWVISSFREIDPSS